jgi:hypothetical protein
MAAVLALIAVEAGLVARGHLLAGGIADAVLLFALLQAAMVRTIPSQTPDPRLALIGLALIPLIRVVALGLPLRQGSNAAATLAIAGLTAFAALSLARTVGVAVRSFYAVRRPVAHLAVAAAGLLLGLLAYALGAAPLWPPGAAFGRVVLSLVAAASAATVAEIVFRGVVQIPLQRVAGRMGVLAASALFASSYLDIRPAALVLVMAVAGLLFAYVVARTGTVGGPLAGHALLVLGAGGFWPAVLGRGHSKWVVSQATGVIALGIAAAVMIALITLQRPVEQAE